MAGLSKKWASSSRGAGHCGRRGLRQPPLELRSAPPDRFSGFDRYPEQKKTCRTSKEDRTCIYLREMAAKSLSTRFVIFTA
jgi:hypothetical protein